jgi:hypothetical protein
VPEAVVVERITHDERAGLHDGVSAKRDVACGFCGCQPDAGFEPLAMRVN